MNLPTLRPATNPGPSRFAGNFAAALVSLAAAMLAPGAAQAATFAVSGTTLAINLTAANESVAITSAGSSYAFALTGSTWSGTDGGGATGNGTATLTATAASFTAVTVADGSTGNAVTFNTSGANTYTSSFTVTLDDATAGTITFNGNTAFAGSSALSASTSRNINVASGAVVSMVDGNLTMSANQQVTPTAGTFVGVLVNNGVLQSTGTGVVSVTGRGGDSGTSQFGVQVTGVSARIQSSGSNVTVTGTGGASSTTDADGLRLEAGGKIITAGSGNLTIVGIGGGGTATTSTGHVGVRVFASEISTVDGALSITGTGGATTSSSAGGQYGIVAAAAAQIKSTGNGTVTLDGRGGGAIGSSFNQGIQIVNAGTLVTAINGLLTLIGTNGAGTAGFALDLDDSAAVTSTGTANIILQADNINLTSNTTINAGNSAVTLIAKTAGRTINLGGTDSTTQMGLSATEIGRITAGTLSLGGTSPVPGPLIVSASIAFSSGTAVNLNYSTISYIGGSTLSGGSGITGSTDIAVEQPAGNNLVDGTASVAFGTVLLGSSADLVFTVKSVGLADLTGLDITLDGANASEFSVFASPAAPVAPNGTTTFTIRFSPTSSGSKSAALHIASNDPNESPFDINLTALGASSSPLSGTKRVGPTGFYASLTHAIADIQTAGLGGALILELQPTYISTVETFPLVFSNLGTTAANTLTIRPQAGATALSISSAAAQTVDLNGAQFVTIDGRPGGVGSHAGSGVGTASQLTIENTSNLGAAVRFINEASGNTLRYTTLRSANAATDGGTVRFFTTMGTNGNDNNTIDHCDIGGGAGTPGYGIYSGGSSATTAQRNSGNTISSCNIFNFYRSSSESRGIYLDGGNTDWTISDNSFYQTSTQTGVNDTAVAVFIDEGSGGNNFTVTGNFIGGGAPNCGGTPWTTTGTSAAYLFQGIRLNVGTTTPSSVQGNTIANMVWTSSSTATALPGVWTGIYVQAGSVNIGTVTGNTIGSGTGTGSISVTTSGSGGTSFGIAAAGTGTRAIAKNTIGSITTSGTDTTISASLVGIQVTAGANTISDNTVGSTTTANSLNAATSSTSTTGQRVMGIFSSSTTSAIVTGNTVANLNNNYAGINNAGLIRGIVTSAGVNTITGNTVRNLSTTSANTASITAASIGQSGIGIAAIATAAGQTVSQNTVHSLANTAAAAAVHVTGIYFAAGTTTGHVIARNFVHSLAVSSSSASSQLNGMQFVAGSFTTQNNLVRVGLDASGSSTAGASIVRGIFDSGPTAGRNFYHNSVYLGGTLTTGSASSRAFDGTSGVSNTRTYQNNLFVNARGNSSGTGKHYAVQYGGTTVNPIGLTAGGNLFLASGTGGVLGLYNSADLTTLADWQSATGQDATSLSADPLYLSPTGTAATVDLHLSSSSPANNAGLALAAVTDDYDGGLRSLTTPDIGADEIGAAANVAPVAGADGLNRPNTTRVAKVLKATLLANDSDADSDTLTLTAVGNALPAGATVAIAGNFVVYTAPANNAGNGSFTYTLSAGAHTVNGTVTVTETTTSGGGGPGNPNALAIVPSGADFAVTFLGVPGGSYRVQYTTSTGEPYTWNEFAPPVVVTAAANGVIPHTDVNPPEPMRLYRAVSNP
jgi:hypothetical protein